MNEPSSGPTSGSRPTTPPACRRRRRDPPQGRLGEPDDRPRRRERHDHDDEQRLGVVDRVVDVVPWPSPSRVRRDRDEQDDRPQAEDHFDFAEEVQHLGAQTRRRRPPCARARDRGAAAPVRETGEARGRKRVEDRQEEDAVAIALNGSICTRMASSAASD